jgi:hypothetical protein
VTNPKKIITRLDFRKRHELTKWIDTHREEIADKTLDQIAAMAKAALDFPISAASVAGVMGIFGLKTPLSTKRTSPRPSYAQLEARIAELEADVAQLKTNDNANHEGMHLALDCVELLRRVTMVLSEDLGADWSELVKRSRAPEATTKLQPGAQGPN